MPLVSLSELVTGAISGEVVSFPTDTVPALAVKPEQSPKIYQLKQRPPDKPLILMAASLADLVIYWQGTSDEKTEWQTLMTRYWPGQLTIVLPASSQVPTAINPLQNGTIALRIPQSPLALEILTQTGPLATTSANLSRQLPLETMTAIAATFATVLTLDCGQGDNDFPLGNGQPSTVIQWQDDHWQILRSGNLIPNL